MSIANKLVALDRKKQAELHYMEEAKRACSVFPEGELIPHERPDFLIRTESTTIGIEVTHLCSEKERAKAGWLSKVPKRAKERFNRLKSTKPLDVSVAFGVHASSIGSESLMNSLVQFVYKYREYRGSDFHKRDLPKGYCHIGIHDMRSEVEAAGHWYGARAFIKGVASKKLVESRIAEKNKRLSGYHLSAKQVWLVIINDQFFGPGEVYTRPEDLAHWKFKFDFDRVLLFSRELGDGEVFELCHE